MSKPSSLFALSIWALATALWAVPANGAEELLKEKDRGTVKRPDYVATPHPEEDSLVSNANRAAAEIPNRSFASHDHNRDGLVSGDEWHGSRGDFIRLDANDDGLLSPRELESYLQIGIDQFSDMDSDHDGILTRGEWRDRSHFFRKLDRDKNGTLTRDEFYQEGG